MTVGGWRGRISRMPPTAVHLTVSDPDAVTPGRWARSTSVPAGLALGARIVLLAAGGHTNTQIARLVAPHPPRSPRGQPHDGRSDLGRPRPCPAPHPDIQVLHRSRAAGQGHRPVCP